MRISNRLFPWCIYLGAKLSNLHTGCVEYYNSHQLIFPLHILSGSERPKMNHAQEVELIAAVWVRKRIANSTFMAHKSLQNTEQFLCVPGSKFT